MNQLLTPSSVIDEPPSITQICCARRIFQRSQVRLSTGESAGGCRQCVDGTLDEEQRQARAIPTRLADGQHRRGVCPEELIPHVVKRTCRPHVARMNRSASVALSRWATIQPTTYRLKTSSMTYR
jgi:hypothetical protein